jgi:xylose isomerase
MIIGRDLLGELGIILNFNDKTVTWDTDTIPMKVRGTLATQESLIEFELIANERLKLGSFTIKTTSKTHSLLTLIMIDTATGCFEIVK